MSERPMVLILSNDEIFRDLLVERLRQDHLAVCEAASLDEVSEQTVAHAPKAIVIDALTDSSLAAGLLDDPWRALPDHQPPLLLLTSSSTPAELRDHPYVDRAVAVPLASEDLVAAVRFCLAGRARRAMKSGVTMRAAVAETFRTKRSSLG
ncbi:MAG: hypothetical protein JRH11_06955 [Deltaproteobacteria bacterium]|nr:hypothetical protein [Deltaproteobacteria bacterium]